MSSGIDMASSFPCTYNSSNNKPDTLLRGVQRASHGDKRQACVHQLFFFSLGAGTADNRIPMFWRRLRSSSWFCPFLLDSVLAYSPPFSARNKSGLAL